MKGFDVLKINSAVKARNKMDLSRTHLTTMQFGEIVPLCAEELIPGDDFNVRADYFSRLAPLVKPTYGKFQFKTVQAFVPYHMLAADAEAWLAGKTTWEGVTPQHRWFSMITLHSFITNVCVTSTGATQSNSVYTFLDTSGVTNYRVFTKVGKYYVKVLNSLGYNMPSGVDLQVGSSWMTNVSALKLSAYPLLAYFKVYNDYMSQSQRFNTSQLSNVLNAVKYARAYSGIWTNSTGEILPGGLSLMFGQVFLCYENDYFTSAWQSPNNSIANNESVSSVVIPQVGNTANVSQNTLNTTISPNLAATSVSIAQRALDFLKAFDNWVRRNNYSGSRSVQQIYSRFGIKTEDYRDHYAHIIGVESMPIQVGDVTATADTTGAALGDYSGKGIMNGSKPFSYKADSYGLLLVLGYFTVTPMNSYGFDRRVLRNTPLDYYNPEFDGLGADAISVGEYFASPIDETRAVLDNATFGFTERYNAYRYGRDVISGEFRTYRANGDMACWHTGRNMAAIRDASHLVAQNVDVNTMPQIDSEYNRIFSNTSGDVDHFYLTAHFDVSAVRPILNLNQVVNLGEGDTVVPRNGNTIS